MKIVHQHSDSGAGIAAGALGGIVQYFLNVDAAFGEKLLEAVITAIICGAAGYLGKEFTVYIKKKCSKK